MFILDAGSVPVCGSFSETGEAGEEKSAKILFSAIGFNTFSFKGYGEVPTLFQPLFKDLAVGGLTSLPEEVKGARSVAFRYTPLR